MFVPFPVFLFHRNETAGVQVLLLQTHLLLLRNCTLFTSRELLRVVGALEPSRAMTDDVFAIWRARPRRTSEIPSFRKPGFFGNDGSRSIRRERAIESTETPTITQPRVPRPVQIIDNNYDN